MARVFISYRRSGGAGHAGRLFDYLRSTVGDDLAFLDLDENNIPPGSDWVKEIRKAIRIAELVLVVIGPRWVNEIKQRQADSQRDPVRMEVAEALKTSVPCIPVLVGGAQMPDPSEIPEDIRKLSDLNAMEVSDSRFDYDAERLEGELREVLGLPSREGARRGASLPVRAEPWSDRETEEVLETVRERGIVQLKYVEGGEASLGYLMVITRGHRKTVPNEFRLVEYGGETLVEDYSTGLVWQHTGSLDTMKIEEARRHVKDLNLRGYCGHVDWRLPTLEEALSLHQQKKDKRRDSFLPDPFSPKLTTFLTGDTAARLGADAWLGWAISFSLGRVVASYDEPHRVVAVRSKFPALRFTRHKQKEPDGRGVRLGLHELSGTWQVRIESPDRPAVRLDLTIRDDLSYRAVSSYENPQQYGSDLGQLSGKVLAQTPEAGSNRLIGLGRV